MTDSIQKPEEKPDSKFRFVLLAAQRAEDMIRGARPKLDHQSGKKTRVAMREISEGMVAWGYGQAPEAAAAVDGDEEPLAAEVATTGN